MRSQQLVPGLVLLSSQLPRVAAWGAMGHEAIAYVAQNFVTSDTETYFQDILGDTSSSYLANVAPWADTYRYTTAGEFSEPYHFIDAMDDPPSSCDVEYSRDCGEGGCVVSAIKNYTSRVSSTSESSANRAMAAKMVIHFVGDIHQPLHDENLELGGNYIDVTYGSVKTDLHAIWDTNMLEQYIGGDTISYALTWSKTLTTAIKTGTYKSDASSWLTGIDIDDAQSSAMVWASDANAYVCSTVMPDGYTVLEKEDLSTTYYKTAIPVIELQLAKAGYRLAAWLNLIATGATGL